MSIENTEHDTYEENEIDGPLIAKFGGSSMARPDIVVRHLDGPERPDVIIVSAPGKTPDFPIKVTDMLIGFRTGTTTTDEIQDRFDAVATLSGGDRACRAIVQQIPQDLEDWTATGNPVESLGEYWSAQLLAAQTGRMFVDAREVITFGQNSILDGIATASALRNRIALNEHYVIPGYYGSRPDGSIQLFPRGGSDITGAIIAKYLNARRYDNWSDVPGFMSADPRKVPNASLIPQITYREARELGNGGSELLHPEVIRILGHTGIKTVMRNTFGALGNMGTEIVAHRDYGLNPIVAVTGRSDMHMLTMHEYGLNEGAGRTTSLYGALESEGISYEHVSTSTDDISIVMPEARGLSKNIDLVVRELAQPERGFKFEQAGLLHIVGEGLAESSKIRLETLGLLAYALSEENIEGMGMTDVGGSVTFTFFIRSKDVLRAIRIAHAVLDLGDAS